MSFLEELSSRRRFGMKLGLDGIRGVCAAMGSPELRVPAVHVAGTNGKGAVCAILDACLRSDGFRIGRYTSPHLVRLNERFFLDGAPVADEAIESSAEKLRGIVGADRLTFFEALTAVAFDLYSAADTDYTILETGLGGRLDATNVCMPLLTVITRIGLDHCDWLGGTLVAVAGEKAGIVKPGIPIVLGANVDEVRDVVERRAQEVGAPFVYAPSVASEDEIPAGFTLKGRFNRENAVVAIAALKMLMQRRTLDERFLSGFSGVVWPGRYQTVGDFIVDGAHNPPAALALAESLAEEGVPGKSLALVAGFCGDKDIDSVLRILSPFVRRGFAVRTCNPRSLPAGVVADRMAAAGIEAVPCESLAAAIAASGAHPSGGGSPGRRALICGSLFLTGEALVELGAYPWGSPTRFDPCEQLVRT